MENFDPEIIDWEFSIINYMNLELIFFSIEKLNYLFPF